MANSKLEMLGLLLVTGAPMSASEIAESLGVTRQCIYKQLCKPEVSKFTVKVDNSYTLKVFSGDGGLTPQNGVNEECQSLQSKLTPEIEAEKIKKFGAEKSARLKRERGDQEIQKILAAVQKSPQPNLKGKEFLAILKKRKGEKINGISEETKEI